MCQEIEGFSSCISTRFIAMIQSFPCVTTTNAHFITVNALMVLVGRKLYGGGGGAEEILICTGHI